MSAVKEKGARNDVLRDRVDGMDPGTRCGWHTNPLSQRARCPAQRRRGSASGREIRCSRTTDLSIIGRQACLAACPSPHDGDGVDAGWVDRTLIALWLGHESVETTQIYLDANLSIKEEVLSKTSPINTKAGRYQPDDDLLAFLKGL